MGVYVDSKMVETDVLIVGAGPTGLTAALELCRYGMKVRVMEKLGERERTSKAFSLWPRTLELLEASGATARFLAAGLMVTKRRMYEEGELLAAMDIEIEDSPFRGCLMIPQYVIELILEELLRVHYGVLVEYSTEVVGVAQDDCSVTCIYRSTKTADGAAFRGKMEDNFVTDGITVAGVFDSVISARWLIGADGAHSNVRKALGMTFPGVTLPHYWKLADVDLKGDDVPDGVHLHLHRNGGLALLPLNEKRVRLAWRAEESLLPCVNNRHPPDLTEILDVMATRAHYKCIVTDVAWVSGFTVSERCVTNFRRGRVFLCGDSAHIHSPAGGHGMNSGMLDAVNLCWKLVVIDKHKMKDELCERLLDSYNDERQPVVRNIIKMSGRLVRLTNYQNPLARWCVRKVVKWLSSDPATRARMNADITQLNVVYWESPLNGPVLTKKFPRPGCRYPVVARSNSVCSAWTKFVPRLKVYTNVEHMARAKAFVKAFSSICDAEVGESLFEDSFVVVRPDGYIAFSCEPRQLPHAYVYMNTVWKHAPREEFRWRGG